VNRFGEDSRPDERIRSIGLIHGFSLRGFSVISAIPLSSTGPLGMVLLRMPD
jgi:hypothetical protein